MILKNDFIKILNRRMEQVFIILGPFLQIKNVDGLI